MRGELDYILEEFVDDEDTETPTLVTKENIEYFVLKNLLLITKQLEEISSRLASDSLSQKKNRKEVISDIGNVRYLLKDIQDKIGQIK